MKTLEQILKLLIQLYPSLQGGSQPLPTVRLLLTHLPDQLAGPPALENVEALAIVLDRCITNKYEKKVEGTYPRTLSVSASVQFGALAVAPQATEHTLLPRRQAAAPRRSYQQRLQLSEQALEFAVELARYPQCQFSFDNRMVAYQLLLRIADHHRMFQGRVGICGPLAFVESHAKSRIRQYAKFVHDLCVHGHGGFAGRLFKPPQVIRERVKLLPHIGVCEVDWLVLATIRNDEQTLDELIALPKPTLPVVLETMKDYGATNMDKICEWVRDAGWTEIYRIRALKSWLHFSSCGKVEVDKFQEPSIEATLGWLREKLEAGYHCILHCQVSLVPGEPPQREGSHFVILKEIDLAGDTVTFKLRTWAQKKRGRTAVSRFRKLLLGLLVFGEPE